MGLAPYCKGVTTVAVTTEQSGFHLQLTLRPTMSSSVIQVRIDQGLAVKIRCHIRSSFDRDVLGVAFSCWLVISVIQVRIDQGLVVKIRCPMRS